MTFDLHTRTIFTYDIHNVSYEFRGPDLQGTVRREVMTHASRAR